MGAFLAFLLAVAKLFYAQPWSKIAIFGVAVFVGGCICGVKLTRSAVKAVTVEAKPEKPNYVFPNIPHPLRDGDAVEAKPVAKLPEAAKAVLVPEVAKPAAQVSNQSACRPGDACYRPAAQPQQARQRQRRRIFGFFN